MTQIRLPEALPPTLVRLINRHSGDSVFLMALKALCQFLADSSRSPAFAKELIDHTKDDFSYPSDEPDFQQLAIDYESGLLSTQALMNAIEVIDRILASNTGTENLSM